MTFVYCISVLWVLELYNNSEVERPRAIHFIAQLGTVLILNVSHKTCGNTCNNLVVSSCWNTKFCVLACIGRMYCQELSVDGCIMYVTCHCCLWNVAVVFTVLLACRKDYIFFPLLCMLDYA